jgi:hypothetical protein
VLYNLLKPFQVHTDVIQSNSCSLSNVILVLVDLSYHLQDPGYSNLLAQPLLNSLQQRVGSEISSNRQFNALALVACYLDPDVMPFLLLPANEALLTAAKSHSVLLVSAVIVSYTQ